MMQICMLSTRVNTFNIMAQDQNDSSLSFQRKIFKKISVRSTLGLLLFNISIPFSVIQTDLVLLRISRYQKTDLDKSLDNEGFDPETTDFIYSNYQL